MLDDWLWLGYIAADDAPPPPTEPPTCMIILNRQTMSAKFYTVLSMVLSQKCTLSRPHNPQSKRLYVNYYPKKNKPCTREPWIG